MACTDSKCVVNSVASIGGNSFTKQDVLDNGDFVSFGPAAIPNKTFQRYADGRIARISQPEYAMQQVTVRIAPCAPAFLALKAEFAQGNNCFDTAIINDKCCGVKSYTDVELESVEDANLTIGEAFAQVVFQGVVQA